MHDKEPTSTTPDTYQAHPIEQRVRAWAVRRTSGDIEKNWIEVGRGTRNGVEYAKLIKFDKTSGEQLEKDVNLEDLTQLRDELRAEKLKEAQKADMGRVAIESIGADSAPINEAYDTFDNLSPEAQAEILDYRRAVQNKRDAEKEKDFALAAEDGRVIGRLLQAMSEEARQFLGYES